MSLKRALSTAGLLMALLAGSVSAADRFTVNHDGTVTDHRMGLMWARFDNQGDIEWKEATQWVTYTFPYTIASPYSDWRLPTLEEVRSLFVGQGKEGYETDCGQWVYIVPEIRLSCGWVWTSETGSLSPTATLFNFHRGTYTSERMVQKRACRALPVRSIK